MKKFIIDCSGIETEEEFWEAYIANVKVRDPDNFGMNLDALWDALHAGGAGSPRNRKCFISVRKTESLKKIRGGDFYDHLRQVAYDLGSDPGSTIKFRVN